jgi:hypothetical protein
MFRTLDGHWQVDWHSPLHQIHPYVSRLHIITRLIQAYVSSHELHINMSCGCMVLEAWGSGTDRLSPWLEALGCGEQAKCDHVLHGHVGKPMLEKLRRIIWEEKFYAVVYFSSMSARRTIKLRSTSILTSTLPSDAAQRSATYRFGWIIMDLTTYPLKSCCRHRNSSETIPATCDAVLW